MSHLPPNGPPPPYYGYTTHQYSQPHPHPHPHQYSQPHPHPQPPAPGAFAYLPTPVVMPMAMYPPQPAPAPAPPPLEPQSQPTYVTNYIYQNQPTYVEDPIDWVTATPTSAASHATRALVAGKEGWDGSPLWVIRAHHSGEFVPGKLAIKHRSAYIPHGGKEVPVHHFEILLANSNAVQWLTASNGQIPAGAIAAGNTHSAEPLYIGRVRHLRSITPGKIHPSHGCCYISFGGNEIAYKSYEVLCRVTCTLTISSN